jgi:hypothetical protein
LRRFAATKRKTAAGNATNKRQKPMIAAAIPTIKTVLSFDTLSLLASIRIVVVVVCLSLWLVDVSKIVGVADGGGLAVSVDDAPIVADIVSRVGVSLLVDIVDGVVSTAVGLGVVAGCGASHAKLGLIIKFL